MLIDDIVTQIKDLRGHSTLVVITGGEPLRQNITKLAEQLHQQNMIVQIETNGTITDNIPLNCQLVCSPKNTSGKYNALSPKILPHIMSLKFLISADIDGYKDIAEIGQSKFNIPVYVQPMDQYDQSKNAKNIKLTMAIAKKHNATLSLQIHKILNIA
jgi:organic radical activating enzyme